MRLFTSFKDSDNGAGGYPNDVPNKRVEEREGKGWGQGCGAHVPHIDFLLLFLLKMYANSVILPVCTRGSDRMNLNLGPMLSSG